jgi:hypothetical protein
MGLVGPAMGALATTTSGGAQAVRHRFGQGVERLLPEQVGGHGEALPAEAADLLGHHVQALGPSRRDDDGGAPRVPGRLR